MKSIWVTTLVCIYTTCWSQAIHNSTSIFIPQNISIRSADVNNSGFIMNNGTVETTGNWNNTNVYQGTGTIILSGSNQSLNNNDQSFEHLLISGGGAKDLNGKLMINGSVDFASGILKVDDTDTLLIKDGSEINGGSSSSFVDGPLNVAGTGFKFFPVGRNGSYYPVMLTEIGGLAPVVQIEAIREMPEVQTSSKVEVDRTVYWMRKNISGTFNGSPVSAPHRYDIIDDEMKERIVFVASEDLEKEFALIDNSAIESNAGIPFVTSKENITQSIFAIGEVPEEPVKPGYLSTSLSPNASNADNRLVKIFGPDIKADGFQFQVVNRWGNVVFESHSLNDMIEQGWNGTQAGQLLPPGAYPYRLAYVDRKGKESTITGFITIVY